MKNDKLALVGIVLLIALLIGLSGFYAYGTQDTVVITIDDKERITTGSGDSLSHKYLIMSDTEVLENTDSLWYMKFDSADTQARLKRGKTYRLKVYGWRMGWISIYRNIIEYTEVQR